LCQVILIGSTILASWMGMQLVHEFGHIVGAWLTGGQVTRVVLWPLSFSRTDIGNNQSPLVVAWAGPVVGIVMPLLLWIVARRIRMPGAFVLRFFAGFCLIANGLYIGLGSFGRVGDCGEMLRYGSAVWQLWLFGAVTAPLGLFLWHRQGTCFGLGAAQASVSPTTTFIVLGACVALLMLGIVIDGR
jgi:hypothetical protein